MTYTAELLSVEKQPSQPVNILAKLKITNTDTGEVTTFETFGNDLTEESIAKMAALRIEAIAARDTALPLLSAKVLVLPDLTPTVPQKERAAFDAAARVFLTAKQLLPPDHADIAVAQQAMLALYKSEYIGIA